MVVLSKQKIMQMAVASPFRIRSSFGDRKGLLADDLQVMRESPASTNHVVIVMDALEEFTTDALRWALENVVTPGCDVTLLALMPWLNIPLFSKTWSEVWAVEFEELPNDGWKTDAKYQKLQSVLRLCRKHKVVPRKKVEMGYPRRLLAVEQVTSLHATWVVFDRHHYKYREYLARKLPCNMVMMNEDGTADMINGRSMMDGEITPGPAESPASLGPTPMLVFSDKLQKILDPRNNDKD